MKKKNTKRLRLLVQLFFLLLIIYISVGHYLEENNIGFLPGAASIHAVCPFGGIATLYTFISQGNYIQKLHQSDIIMVLALLGTLILGGAFFCGWICPLGAVQEWLGKLGKKIFRTGYNKVPHGVDRYLRYLKYLILLWVVIETARTGKLIVQDYDPYYNLFNIWTDEIAVSGYIVVAVTLLLSLFIERPFCRYACPLGAVNGLFNSISILKIKRKDDSCISCSKCDQSCPAGIVVSRTQAVNSPDCIRCLECIDSCPVNKQDEILEVRPIFTAKRVVKKGVYIFLILLIFGGSIIFSVENGTFITERIKVYQSIADIRGSVTIQELVDHYPITRSVLGRAFAIPETISLETKLKDIAGLMGLDSELEIVSPEGIRTVVDLLDKDMELFIEENDLSSAEITAATGLEIIKELTLLEFINNSPRGSIAYLLSGHWPQTGAGSAVNNDKELIEIATLPEIKGYTTLGEIKEMVENFPLFLKRFSLPEEISLFLTLRELRDKYGIEIGEIRAYIEENYPG